MCWHRNFDSDNSASGFTSHKGKTYGTAYSLRIKTTVLLCLLAFFFLSGCAHKYKWIIPYRTVAEVPQKSVEELFYEAAYHAYPEKTLGVQPVPFEDFRENERIESEATEEFQPPPPPPPMVPPSEAPLDLTATSSTEEVDEPDKHVVRQIDVTIDKQKIVQVQALEAPQLVNEFFEETDVRQAIQSMATQAGVSVIMDDQVSGVVSILLEDEPFDDALEKVLLPLGLVSKKQKDGSYLVGLPDPQSPLFPLLAERMRYLPLHVSPKQLVEALSPRSKSFVRLVELQNQIVIEAPAAIANSILEELKETDQPSPQVMLEAIICVVEPDSGFRFGLDWGHAVELNEGTALDLGIAGLSLGGGVSPAGFKSFFNDFAFTTAFIQLLEQNGYLSIRASPRVMALNGQRAEISIVRQTFFSTQPLSTDVIFRQDIREVEAGIDMAIIPTVRGSNVHVQIEKAEVSEDIRSQTTDRNLVTNPFPIINRRRVTTNVTVGDGKTIVIGGLVARQTVDRISHVPGLRKAKGIGSIFERIEKQDKESEVVIFISPKIIYPEENKS